MKKKKNLEDWEECERRLGFCMELIIVKTEITGRVRGCKPGQRSIATVNYLTKGLELLVLRELI